MVSAEIPGELIRMTISGAAIPVLWATHCEISAVASTGNKAENKINRGTCFMKLSRLNDAESE